MKIAIAYHDNDFFSTFKGVLMTLLTCYRFEEELLPPKSFTKQRVLEIIHQIAYGCYLLYQHRFRDESDDEDDEDEIHLKGYFKKVVEVFIGDEVDTLIAQYPHGADHGIVILDTDLDYPGTTNDPIYFL